MTLDWNTHYPDDRCDCVRCRHRYRQGRSLHQLDASERAAARCLLVIVCVVLLGVVVAVAHP